MNNKTQVAKKKNGDSLPAVIKRSADDLALGGKVTAADMALPFLQVLQGLSGPLKKDNPNFIKGAAIGDLYLSVLNRRWDGDEGVEIIPCHYSRVYCERDPDIVTGPPINTYADDDPLVINTPRGEKGVMRLANGHVLQETAFHAVLVKVDNKWQPAVLPLRGTAIKHSKRWNNQIMNYEVVDSNGAEIPASRWERIWRLTTGTETGGGNSWAAPVFEPVKDVDQALYDTARKWAIAAGKLTNLATVEAAHQEGKTPESDEF